MTNPFAPDLEPPVEDVPAARVPAPTTAKVLVAGGFGAGKTTFVSTISDIAALSTEERVSGSEPLTRDKVQTTVALDFGRVALEDTFWLYLFGTPGQERFRFMWEDLAVGATGAVVLVDTDHLDGCFPSIDFFEQVGLPFLVSVNCFDGIARHQLSEIRDALAVPVDVPVLYTDARSRPAARQTLQALVDHTVRRRTPGYPPVAAPEAPGIFGAYPGNS